MKLTGEEARNVVSDDHDDWKPVGYTGVFQHVPSGKFYCFYQTVGATEAYEKEVEVDEVVKKLVQTEQWVSPESPGLLCDDEGNLI